MITASEMKQLESDSGISLLTLMDRAGKAVYDTLNEKFALKNRKILVVCYHGNNGGDGFVAADLLSNESEVDILFVGDEEKLKKEARVNYKKVNSNERIQFVNADDADFDGYDVIIDAIFGIGFKGELGEEISSVIEDLNKSKAFKLSIDVPTGYDADTGEVLDKCVNADLVVTFHDIKPGLEKISDKVIVADIGL